MKNMALMLSGLVEPGGMQLRHTPKPSSMPRVEAKY